jgi:hypothetical protein
MGLGSRTIPRNEYGPEPSHHSFDSPELPPLALAACACTPLSHHPFATGLADQVELLAGLSNDGNLTVKLSPAIRDRNDLVSLSTSDRARIVDVLPTRRLPVLPSFRSVLVRQLKQARDHETEAARSREAQQCVTRESGASRNDC